MVDYEALADQEEKEGPSDEELKTISKLIARQVELEDWIEKQLERLAKAQARLDHVSMNLLPEAMAAAGCSEYRDADGNGVEVKEDLKAGITEANQEWCFKWLSDNGHGDIIRNEFKVSFGVGEDTDAQGLADFLLENDQGFNQKRYIHHRTLPAWCRAELEENDHGEEWEKKFGIFHFKKAKITRPG